LINIKKLPYNITRHNFFSGIYFNFILKKIIGLIVVNKFTKILDFGCGFGYLKKSIRKNNNITVINYDIIAELSEVKTYKNLQIDCLVANQVFYLFEKKKLNNLLIYLKNKLPGLSLIVVISRQSLLNNIGKFILNNKNAHKGSKLSPSIEFKILKKHCYILKKLNIFFLSDIYLLSFNRK
jgi:predicted TPR repeat methyltransferase